MKAICTLSYKAWGRLSKGFLEEITIPAPETGEVWNIITALWETNDNLMQLLGRKYKFMEVVEEFNLDKKSDSLNYETISGLIRFSSSKKTDLADFASGKRTS